MKFLLAFDFDHTIVDDNTDTFIFKLGENGDIPVNIKQSYKKGRWTEFMNNIFQYLHSSCGVTKEAYAEVLKSIPLTADMDKIFTLIREKQSTIDFIIISDSNTWFIETILSHHDVSDLPTKIFTNEACFNDNGALCISPYHSHSHKICPFNLCKGKVMQEFLANRQDSGIIYDQIIYVGDGGNDFCPSTTLSAKDILFARKGYGLQKKLSNLDKKVLQCKVEIWDNGNEIVKALTRILRM